MRSLLWSDSTSESHMARRPSSRKQYTPNLPPRHALPLSHDGGPCVARRWSLVLLERFEWRKGKPRNGLDFYWSEIMIKNPEIFFTNQQNVKIIYNQRWCGIVCVSLTAEKGPKEKKVIGSAKRLFCADCGKPKKSRFLLRTCKTRAIAFFVSNLSHPAIKSGSLRCVAHSAVATTKLCRIKLYGDCYYV